MTEAATKAKIAKALGPLAVPIGNVRPMERNPRRGDVEAVARSYERFGQRKPIVVRRDAKARKRNGSPTGEVIAGSHQLLAAEQLGWTEIAVVFVEDDDRTATAYALADNRTADLGTYDDDVLAELLRELGEDDVDGLLEAASFDQRYLVQFFARHGTGPVPGEDDVPVPPEKPATRPGDLYVLGAHRLLCGDATDAEVVGRLLGDAVPTVMATDPPYGVGYDPSWREEEARKGNLWYGPARLGKVENDDRVDWTDAYRLAPGPVAYVWHAALFAGEVAAHLLEAGFELRAEIIWVKPYAPISRGHYNWQHEPIWYASPQGGDGRMDRTDDGEHRLGGDSAERAVQGARRPRGRRHGPRHAEAGGLVRASVRSSRGPRRCRLRPVRRLGDRARRGREDGATLLRHRRGPGLLRRRGRAVGELHRAGGDEGADVSATEQDRLIDLLAQKAPVPYGSCLTRFQGWPCLLPVGHEDPWHVYSGPTLEVRWLEVDP
jgi:hypothetical protein